MRDSLHGLPVAQRDPVTRAKRHCAAADRPLEAQLDVDDVPIGAPSLHRPVQIIDQRFLPHRFIIEDVRTTEEMATAIREMHVRGAGLIGAAAAFGIYEGIARVIGLPVPELPIAARGYVSVHVKEFFGFFAISS